MRTTIGRVAQKSDEQPEITKESSRFATRLEPGSGSIGVHDESFGKDHYSTIDQSLNYRSANFRVTTDQGHCKGGSSSGNDAVGQLSDQVEPTYRGRPARLISD